MDSLTVCGCENYCWHNYKLRIDSCLIHMEMGTR